MIGSEEARAASTPEAAVGGGLRLLVVRVLNYLTNSIVAHLPSFGLRRLWYTRVLGARLADHAGIHMGCYIWFYGPGQVRRDGLVLGAHSRINRRCTLDVRGGLHVGENVSISPEVSILTAAHRSDHPDFPVEARPVVIEDNVWVGTRATILPGVTLGRGSVVAAGAVVTRPVLDRMVVGGVPASVIRSRESKRSA